MTNGREKKNNNRTETKVERPEPNETARYIECEWIEWCESVRIASVIVHDYESNEVAISLIESLGKMAESKGSLLAKSVQKHAGRAKEKVCVLVSVFVSHKFCHSWIGMGKNE